MDLTKSFFAFIFLILLVFSARISSESEVYEIDYRGPETHSSVIPPPGHSHGRPSPLHHQTTSAASSEHSNNGGNVKKIHG